MAETIQINMNDIPAQAGSLTSGHDDRKKLKVISITELKIWVMDQIQNANPDTKIVIGGYMSNCIALQIGIWLAGRGDIHYKNHSGFSWRMV